MEDRYLKMVETVLSYNSLDKREREIFSIIKEKLEHSEKISRAQQAKIDFMWNKLGLGMNEAGAKNLWSSGKVPMGKPMAFPYDLPRPVPFKPPGMK